MTASSPATLGIMYASTRLCGRQHADGLFGGAETEGCGVTRLAAGDLTRFSNLAIIIARMYAIDLTAEARDELSQLRPFDARRLLDTVERALRTEPAESGANKKLLRGLTPTWNQGRPVWQLRVGGFRVFYDVDESSRRVSIRAIRLKGRRTTEEIT